MLRRSVPALLACLAVVGANVTTPSEAQLKWQDFEVGAMITWNLQTLCTQVKARASAQRCQVGGSGFVPNLDATMQWNPTKLDTDKWVRVAKSFGAKYIVLVADHMAVTGFTLWDTKAHNFSMAHTKWRGGGGDVVQEFVASCRKYGVAPGLFYSSHFNWNLGVNDYMVGWPRLNGGPQLTQTEFDKIVQQQLEELLQNYGDIVEIWFDGGVNNSATPSVGPTVNRLAPNAVCHSCAGFSSNGLRWMGNEEGVMPLPSWGACDPDLSPFTGDPLGSIYAPPSTDTVLDEHYWFWTPDAKSHRVTTKQLVSRYLTSVGRSSNLILNMAPDDMGDIGDDDVAAYDAFGKAITCLFSERVSYTTDVNVEDGSATWGVKVESMSNGAFNLSLHVMEDISTGQLIGNWSLFASMESPSSTATLSLLSNETAIGHKRILNIVTPPTGHRETITELRLVVWDNYAGPGQSMRLRSVEVFDWSAKQSCV